MNAIEISELCKAYRDFTLDHFSLTLPSGCILGLVGENGAGKTTTIRLLLNTARRDSGDIRVFGKDCRSLSSLEREDIGVVLGEPGLSAHLGARQTGKIMADIFHHWDEDTYETLLKRWQLPMDKPYKDYSRGMKMKLSIAIALSHRAKLLVLDEPTNGLDPLMRDDVMQTLTDFTRDETHSVLISSHIVSDLEKVCDYVAFLHRGKLLLCEERDRLVEKYGVLHCTADELRAVPTDAVLGRRANPYGVEALVRRDALPGRSLSPVDIETLFIYMAKEAG